jgi:tetratricopeptide (TPR) repeat protein
VIRFRYLAVFVAGALLALAAFAHPAFAASTPAPAATPVPTPAPTPTPEALDVQVPRLEAAIKADPTDKQSMAQLANDYLTIGRPDQAVVLTQKLLAGGTKTAIIYAMDGAAQAALGKQAEGIASMEQARNIDPSNIQFLVPLTQMYMAANRPADAERIAKSGATLNPSSKEAALNYGIVLASERKFDESRVQFENAATLDPKDPHALVLEARTYEDANALALAMPVLDRAIAEAPTNLEALAAKAELASAQHDVKTAVATFTTILGLMPDDANRGAVTDQIAIAYAREKMDSDADAAYRRAIDSYGGMPPAHIAYGDYLAGKKDMNGAVLEWTAAVGANRDNPDALARLGQAAAAGNDLTTAIADFKRLTEVVSSSPQAYLLLGQAYMANKNWDSAHDAFKASYNLAHSLDSLVGMAAADQQSRNYTEELQIYEGIHQNADVVKANPGLLYNMGTAYRSANQPQKAKATYTEFLTYLKPGTQGYTEIKQLIADLDRGSSPRPAPKPTAKPEAKPKAKPGPKPSASPAPKK